MQTHHLLLAALAVLAVESTASVSASAAAAANEPSSERWYGDQTLDDSSEFLMDTGDWQARQLDEPIKKADTVLRFGKRAQVPPLRFGRALRLFFRPRPAFDDDDQPQPIRYQRSDHVLRFGRAEKKQRPERFDTTLRFG